MAGNDDRHGISACVRPSGTDGFGRTCPLGKVAITDGFSVWDDCDFSPDLLLKIGAGYAQRDREIISRSREIFLELLRRLPKNRELSIERPPLTRGGNVITADKIKAGQRRRVGDQHEVAYRAIDEGIIIHDVFSSFFCLFHVNSFHCHFLD